MGLRVENNIRITQYQLTYRNDWNKFLKSADSSFLFLREFMEYHAHKFEDFSLLIFNQEDLIAICPAHKEDDILKSHWGLTYGGVIWKNGLSLDIVDKATNELLVFLRQKGFYHLQIKALPEFYMDELSQRQNQVFKAKAQINHQDRVFAIDYNQPLSIHKTKRKHYRKGHSVGFKIEASNDYKLFWNQVLIPRLKAKHGVEPVHSLSEIKLLGQQFPRNIIQYNISLDDEILAGITIFDKGMVVKSQYGATTDKGEKLRALEYLFMHLIYKYKEEGRRFFSMGTIGDDRFPDGYNPGLKKQKEELGCRMYVQQFFTFDIV